MNELKKEEREGERKAGREGGSSYEVQVTGTISTIIRCLKASKYPRSLGVSSNMPSKDRSRQVFGVATEKGAGPG